MRDVGLGDKVYSPDLQTFELDGPTGAYGMIASLFVGPLRLLTRVVHNVMILPADLLSSYASGLFVTSSVLLVIGIIDLVLYHKWPLVVSQIPVLAISVYLSNKAKAAVVKANVKAEVEIDDEQVEELCNSLIPELDKIMEGD